MKKFTIKIAAIKKYIKSCRDLKLPGFEKIKSRQFQIKAIKKYIKNCHNLETNRWIAAAAPIGAPDRDFPTIIRSPFKQAKIEIYKKVTKTKKY